ncbi:MAG: aldo/keto reductase [Acidobacteriia bacterium]|nr:aldo/keto reductase [Terriglobia bacterium]
MSNFSVAQLRDAQQALGKCPVVSNQVRYSLIDRTIEKDLLPYYEVNKITVIAYCPLARGLNGFRDCDPGGATNGLVRAAGKSSAQIVLN